MYLNSIQIVSQKISTIWLINTVVAASKHRIFVGNMYKPQTSLIMSGSLLLLLAQRDYQAKTETTNRSNIACLAYYLELECWHVKNKITQYNGCFQVIDTNTYYQYNLTWRLRLPCQITNLSHVQGNIQ